MQSKELYKKDFILQKESNQNRLALQGQNAGNYKKYYPSQQRANPAYEQLSEYLNASNKLNSNIEPQHQDYDYDYDQFNDQRESINSLKQDKQLQQEMNENYSQNMYYVQETDRTSKTNAKQEILDQQIQKLEKQYKELFQKQEEQNQILAEENKQLQIKNQELLNMLTMKESRIDSLYQEIKHLQQSKKNQDFESVILENEELKGMVNTLQEQLQQQDRRPQANQKITGVQQQINSIPKSYYQAQSHQNLQNNETFASLQNSQKEINFSGTTPINFEEKLVAMRQASYSAQMSARKNSKNLNISHSTQRNDSRNLNSQDISPRHNRQLSIQSKSSDRRVPTGFDQNAPSIVYKNTLVPYLGKRDKTRSRSPEKRGIEEMCAPFLSGADQRWQYSLRSDSNPTQQSKKQNKSNPLEQKPPRRADQISQDLRKKIMNEYKQKNSQQFGLQNYQHFSLFIQTLRNFILLYLSNLSKIASQFITGGSFIQLVKVIKSTQLKQKVQQQILFKRYIKIVEQPQE